VGFSAAFVTRISESVATPKLQEAPKAVALEWSGRAPHVGTVVGWRGCGAGGREDGRVHFCMMTQANAVVIRWNLRQTAGMERMRIYVQEIQRRGRRGPWVASAYVLSCERVGGSARAEIKMTLQLEDSGSGVTRAQLRRLARQEELRFLDVE
jgi:hypothetical protein